MITVVEDSGLAVAPVDGTTVETTGASPAATTTEKNRSRFRELPGYNPNGFGFGGISRKIPSTTRTTRKPRVTFATTAPSVRVTARSPSTVAPRYQTHTDRSIIMKQTTDASPSPRQPVTATTPSTPPPPPTAPTTVLPPSSAICGGGIESDRGDIVSPDYPIGYKRGLVCYWNITVSQQAPRIKLEFLKLNLGLEDFVELKSYTGQVLRHYTGREKTKLFVTTTRQIAVLFVSKNDGLGKGFVLNYLATYAGPTRITNSAPYSPVMFLTESMGNLTSPNFPAPYYNLEDMRWVLIAPPGHVIAITLIGEDFYLEKDYDYLLVGDGNLLENPIMNITGKLNSSLAYVFSDKTSKMWIQFKSDETNAKKGFRLYYSVMPVGLAAIRKELAAMGITPANKPREVYVKPDYSKKEDDDEDYDDDMTTDEPTTTTPEPINGFVVVMIDGISKDLFNTNQNEFKRALAAAAALYCDEFDCLAAIRKELAALGITPANKPREVYVKPDYSKKEDVNYPDPDPVRSVRVTCG
ncbi:PREDICTED: cubilin-like [Priapulus caudatus]|uniref:Cubilin-like n=1 Tax=Priapulus caudatus TaxID=37621 RepID=A0ABM1ERR5_PRICU|nr:PREDICTED: cubilin-like [Priapulus caudatus]